MPTADELYDEAIALQEADKLEEAVGKLESLLAEHPDHALAHAALSVFCGNLERHEDAVDHARKVCQLEPDDPFSFTAMSIVCRKAGNMADAEQAMAQAMEKQWERQKRGEP